MAKCFCIKFISFSFILVLSLLPSYLAVTYNIDAISCFGPTSVDAAMEEVQRMSSKAWTKLTANDPIISEAFDIIFRTEVTDIPSKLTVLSTSSSLHLPIFKCMLIS